MIAGKPCATKAPERQKKIFVSFHLKRNRPSLPMKAGIAL
jgi:hypothetical protein